MEELLKKRLEITIELNKAIKKLEEEGDGFIDRKYLADVFRWNKELEKIISEIDNQETTNH